jgi:UDP-glucose 4-epimerase
MRLLVTGGAGYIGSIVANHLLAERHEVVVLDNLERGHRQAVPPAAELVVADLLHQDALAAAVTDGFDGVLHFAALALVGEAASNPERYWRTNVGGTLNLLEAMVEAGCRGLSSRRRAPSTVSPTKSRSPRARRPGRSTPTVRRSWRSIR